MLIVSVSQFILLLLPQPFVTHPQTEGLQLSSCSGLHKSHQGKFMVDRCSSKWAPSIVSSLREGGFTVTDSDPDLTSPCVATETEEPRKREEAEHLGSYVLTQWGKERTRVYLLHITCLCVPPPHCCLSFRFRHHLRNTCCCCLLLKLSPRPTSTPSGSQY